MVRSPTQVGSYNVSREKANFQKGERRESEDTKDTSLLSSSTGEGSNMPSTWVDADKLPKTVSAQNEKLSISDVKRMVMDSIPEKVRGMIPPETWERVINEASDAVLTEDSLALQKEATEEDMRDIISYISVYVQREAKGGRSRKDSDVSELTYQVPEANRPRTPMDAVALAPIDQSVAGDDRDAQDSIASEVEPAQQASRSSHSSRHRRSAPPVPHVTTAAVLDHAGRIGREFSSAAAAKKKVLPESAPSVVNSNQGQTGDERRIAFSLVEIRLYERILTDNPAVTSGPPLGIGWKYRIMDREMTIDAWEHRQLPNRRYLTELVVPRNQRTSILYDLGYSQKEVAFAVREVLKIKNKRKQTYNNLRFQSMEELIEKTGRRFKKVLTLGMTGRREKKLLAPYTGMKTSRGMA